LLPSWLFDKRVRSVLADRERIFSLGISSMMNLSINQGGRPLVTINLSEAGYYSDVDVPTAKVQGALLAPVLLASARK
jgi:hypothetical protein